MVNMQVKESTKGQCSVLQLVWDSVLHFFFKFNPPENQGKLEKMHLVRDPLLTSTNKLWSTDILSCGKPWMMQWLREVYRKAGQIFKEAVFFLKWTDKVTTRVIIPELESETDSLYYSHKKSSYRMEDYCGVWLQVKFTITTKTKEKKKSKFQRKLLKAEQSNTKFPISGFYSLRCQHFVH